MHQPEQLQLFEFFIQPEIKAIHDPYWDELEAKKEEDIVDQAFLSINALDENLDIGVEIAPQQNTCVGAQISFDAPPYKCVGAQVATDTKKTAPQHDMKLYGRDTVDKPTHWVEKYWVERVSHKYWYYRYCWMEGRKKSRVYIGAVASRKAQLKKEAVIDAIADGEFPQEIKQLIRGFSSHVPPFHHYPKLP